MVYVNAEAGEVVPNRSTRASVSLSELNSTPVQRRACRGVDMALSLAHYLVCEGTMPLALPRFEDVNATPHDVPITLTALVRAARDVRRAGAQQGPRLAPACQTGDARRLGGRCPALLPRTSAPTGGRRASRRCERECAPQCVHSASYRSRRGSVGTLCAQQSCEPPRLSRCIMPGISASPFDMSSPRLPSTCHLRVSLRHVILLTTSWRRCGASSC